MNYNLHKDDRIYLMTPYSASHLEGMERKELEHIRFLQAVRSAGILISKGLTVFSPIAHSHPIAVEHEMDGTFITWAALDYSFIDWWATVGIVVKFWGWDRSAGVLTESVRMGERRLPVHLVHPTELDSIPIT